MSRPERWLPCVLVSDYAHLPQSLLVASPLNRYPLNASMLPQLARDADGGVTLYIQNESPGKELGRLVVSADETQSRGSTVA